jgi:SAM-dependent methyltransferase
MKYEILKDIINWDIINWSKALMYWDKNFTFNKNNYVALEVGAREGGLSLWLAMKGCKVICTDLESPEKKASEIHKKYTCSSLISYEALDATNIKYNNHFDIITFKSILGGIGRNDTINLKQQAINEMYQALKPDGVLFFSENIEGSMIHRVLRKRFSEWGNYWNYLKYEDVNPLLSAFKQVDYITVGFFGTFGRNEKQRSILGKIDSVFEKIIPKSKRYIVIGIAKK